MKECDNKEYSDEKKVLKTELELDENEFKPLDEVEGLYDNLIENFEPKDELENEDPQIKIDFIPYDINSLETFSKRGNDEFTKLEIDYHPNNYKYKFYSEKDVRSWMQQYKNYKYFKKVQNHLRAEGEMAPAISTIQNRIKLLLGKEKYKEFVRKYTFNDAKMIVSQMGISKTGISGKILSNPEDFKGVKSKLSIQCGKCNHSWTTILDAIIHNKSWCPNCATKHRVANQRGSVRKHQKIITQRGGRLIGVIYEDAKEKLFNQRTRFKIECQAGHKFNINASNLKIGRWCRKCSHTVIGVKNRGSFQDIQNLIEKRGGQCISKPEDYKNQHQKLKIQCDKDHIFERRPTNLKRGDWCPVCSQGRFEKICRSFFEEIFQNEFPKERPKWLINSRGNQMELDGYNKGLGLAFEAQGEQHYHAVAHFDQTLKDLEQRIQDDLLKLELCNQKNIKLIQIPYYVHPNNIQHYITAKYENLMNEKLPIIPKIDYNRFLNTPDDQKNLDDYL
ncbi:MAG TPA: hypothetical protein VMV43_09775 [Candidatus Nanopelagicaceae bacterium]|nr:hypothetical protein [Candidatus Nanopelagicaceae bacterium]